MTPMRAGNGTRTHELFIEMKRSRQLNYPCVNFKIEEGFTTKKQKNSTTNVPSF